MKLFLRSYAVLLLLSASCFISNGQNLVLNPSFEQTSACPQGISQFNLATDWAQGNSGADSCSTSDLYAGCTSQIGGSNSPNGLLGYQPSRTGTHHAGVILGEGFLGCTLIGDNYREYIEGHTSSPLVAGQRYLVRFYVSLPEDVMGGSDDLGVYFSNTYYSHNACNGQLMPLTPQLNYCGPCLMDTINWTEVRWIYTATGGESYFVIGNFKNDGNTTLCGLDCGGFTQNPYIYYYIDDVEISPVGANECSFALTTTTKNAGCANNDGSATVLATGCTTPFQYAWSNAGTAATINNVASGNYTVTVTDATTCTATISAAIGAFTPPTLQVNTINAGCTTNTGTAIASVVTGTGPYTYAWSNSANTQTINNLAAGNYTVTVTAAGNCSASASGTIAAAGGNLSLTGSSTAAGCGSNNGSATVTVNNNPGPFTYNWSNAQTTQTISNVPAGTYLVTVSSGTTINPTPFYSEDFTGGQGSWTFSDGPGTNGAQANLWVVNNDADCSCHAGNYLHITCNPSSFTCLGSSGSCTYFTGSPIPNPLFGDPTADKLAISPAISTVGKTNITLQFNYQVGGDPGVDYGKVRLSGDGGTTWTEMPTEYSNTPTCTQATVGIPNSFEGKPNFKIAFRWINNQDGNGDDPGFVIDSIRLIEGSTSNCPSVATVNVPSGTLSLTPSSISTSCGQNNGSASVSTGGSGSYTYNWSNGATSASINNVAAGTYIVTVQQGGNCSATASATVASSTAVTATATPTATTCGNNNGGATAGAVGGTATGFSWSNGGTNATISNVAAGNYTVTVTAGTCSATATAAVASSNPITASATSTSAGCTSTGSATATINGGTAATYAWNNGGTTATISNLAAGNYTVTITSSASCTATASAVVGSSGGLTLSASSVDASCGNNNGSATVNITSGTATAYTWNNGATSATATNLVAGTYTVTVTGAGGCSATASAVVGASGAPVIATSATGTGCNGNTGSATVTITTGTATAYAWSSGATTATASNLAAGTYTVTVTGTAGCTVTASVTVNATSGVAISASSTNTSCGNNNGTASVTVNQGTPTNYIWSNGGTSANLISLSAGTYTVTVSDANGCSATASVIVGGSGTGNVTITSGPATICVGDSVEICAPSNYVSYLWNNGATGNCIFAKQAGNYYVTVTDNGNCTAASNHLAINVYQQPPVSISVNGDTLVAYNSLTYQWYRNGVLIPGATNAQYIPNQTGSYTVQVGDINGCTAQSLPVVITVTGVEELAKETMTVYPNPNSSSQWGVSVSNGWIGGNCEVFDATGRLVYQAEIKDHRTDITLNIASGVYMLKVSIGSKTAVQKLIKL